MTEEEITRLCDELDDHLNLISNDYLERGVDWDGLAGCFIAAFLNLCYSPLIEEDSLKKIKTVRSVVNKNLKQIEKKFKKND